MDAGPLIERILNDEGLTADFPEADAEAVVGWLIVRAKALAASGRTPATANRRLEDACRHARGVGEVMAAWRADGDPAAAAKGRRLVWKPGKTPAETLTDLLNQFAFTDGTK